MARLSRLNPLNSMEPVIDDTSAPDATTIFLVGYVQATFNLTQLSQGCSPVHFFFRFEQVSHAILVLNGAEVDINFARVIIGESWGKP